MSIFTRGKLPTPLKPTPFNLGKFWLPKLIIVTASVVVLSDQAGYINLPHILQFNRNKTQNETIRDSSVYEIPKKATIGVLYAHDFYEELISLLGPKDNPPIYSFYFGTMGGFPPMGLTLWPFEGVLRGIPTGKSSEFEVCIKDSGGKSACRKYSLEVQPKSIPTTNTTNTKPKLTPAPIVQPKSTPTPKPTSTPNENVAVPFCPPRPKCGSTFELPATEPTPDGVPPISNPQVWGTQVSEYCDCPSDMYFGQWEYLPPGEDGTRTRVKMCLCPD